MTNTDYSDHADRGPVEHGALRTLPGGFSTRFDAHSGTWQVVGRGDTLDTPVCLSCGDRHYDGPDGCRAPYGLDERSE